MGVRGLQSFLRQQSIPKTLDDLCAPSNARLRIGIDISYQIYRLQGNGERILEFLRKLEANQHRILLVFDGRAEDGKQWEAQRRREAREQELKSASDIRTMLDSEEMTEDMRLLLEKKAAEHQRKGWSLTRESRHALKSRFQDEKIPMVKAKGEADGLLSALSNRGDLDLIISGDMDLIAMGAKVVWAPQDDGFSFREQNREKILEEIELTDYQFRSMCAICFTESSQEQNPLDIRQAQHLMKVFRSLTNLRQKYPNQLKIWPDDNHIFQRSVDVIEPWIREDQMNIWLAFKECKPMPQT